MAYFDIPENKERLYDMIIKQVRLPEEMGGIPVDIGINLEDSMHEGRLYYKGVVENFGDLSRYAAYTYIEGEGLQVGPAKLYVPENEEGGRKKALPWQGLLRQGYAAVLAPEEKPEAPFTLQPLSRVGQGRYLPAPCLQRGAWANFFLCKKEVPQVGIINGFAFDIGQETRLLSHLPANGLCLP